MKFRARRSIRSGCPTKVGSPDHLQVGDACVDSSGRPVKVASKQLVAEPQPVYNIEVEGCHTYYVGKNGQYVLVHNQCIPTSINTRDASSGIHAFTQKYGKTRGIIEGNKFRKTIATDSWKFSKKHSQNNHWVDNALKHAYLMAMTTYVHGEKLAKTLGTLRELGDTDSIDNKIDLYNNKVGRDIGNSVRELMKDERFRAENPDIKKVIEDKCLEALRNGDLIVSPDDVRWVTRGFTSNPMTIRPKAN